jgi:hypothetical protein
MAEQILIQQRGRVLYFGLSLFLDKKYAEVFCGSFYFSEDDDKVINWFSQTLSAKISAESERNFS